MLRATTVGNLLYMEPMKPQKGWSLWYGVVPVLVPNNIQQSIFCILTVSGF